VGENAFLVYDVVFDAAGGVCGARRGRTSIPGDRAHRGIPCGGVEAREGELFCDVLLMDDPLITLRFYGP